MAIEKVAGLAATVGPAFRSARFESRIPVVIPTPVHRAPAPAPTPAGRADQAVRGVCAAQHRLDRVLELAQSGKSFTPAELLALQANVYRASQELDLAGKVVEKATSGVKQILQTQV